MTSTGKGTKTLQEWFTSPYTDLKELYNQAWVLTQKTFKQKITAFRPGTAFPSVSVTGTRCKLHCQHCAGHFLHHMHTINTPQELITFCNNLANKQGVGCLISGGCDENGTIPLTPFLSAFSEIKQSTNLLLNVHTGFLSAEQARGLSQTGIDYASVDVVGDDQTIHTVYGLTQRTTTDYIETLKALEKSHIPIAPHICVGLQNGTLVGELNALELIKSTIKPKLIVIIALMPTEGTPMAASDPPQPPDVARICAIARLLFPNTEIALGCMRPRGAIRHQMEQLAIQAGITRLVQPTNSTLHYLEKNGYTVSWQNACCVI
ncbi:MAG: radical SAM protein [Candidatus Thorarchaeota archaeon]